jgi:hypothetical protein
VHPDERHAGASLAEMLPIVGTRPSFATSGAWKVRVLTHALAPATLILGATSIGYLIAIGHVSVAAAPLIAAVLLVLAVRAPGPFVALMLLVIMNGLPGVDLSGRLGPTRIQDYAVIALIVVLHARGREAVNSYGARLVRLARLWAACLVAWWILTVARSVLISGIPILKAALFGREFLYFAILLPVALRARIPRQSLKAGAVLLCGGIIAYTVGQVTISLSGAQLPWLVHPYLSLEVGGLTRVYSPLGDVVSVSLLFVFARLLSKEGRHNRIVLSGLTALFALAVVLELTRANYFAMLIALVVAVIVYTMRRGALTAVTFRIAMSVLAVMLVTLLIGGLRSGVNTRITSAVSSRLEAGVQNVSNTTGTFGYRYQLDEKMLAILGPDWPVGLGFLHPEVHYVAGLPNGSIRNSDTGVFNALMTMGVVGALLLYVPLVFAFMELVRLNGRSGGLSRERQMWLVYGGTAWVTWVVAGSATLVVLFSVTGLVLTALVLAALGQSRLDGELQRQ